MTFCNKAGSFSKRSISGVKARGLTVIAWQNDLLLEFAVAAEKKKALFVGAQNGKFVVITSNGRSKEKVGIELFLW